MSAMSAELDHLILPVNDAPASAAFYAEILGFATEGRDGPFTVVRVNDRLTMQLAPWGTKGGVHLAFAVTRAEFDAAFARVRGRGLRYGPTFDTVGQGGAPGAESGARGMGDAVYFFDPNEHLIEIRRYERG